MRDTSALDNLYISYFRKEKDDYYARVHFYEHHLASLRGLAHDQWQEVCLDYHLCLFSIGKYDRYLREVDDMIEMVIEDNIYDLGGMDIYKELLYRKCMSQFYIGMNSEAWNLAKQLMRMGMGDAIHPVITNIYRQTSQSYLWVQGIAIASLFTFLSLGFTEFMLHDPQYAAFSDYLSVVRKLFFGIGVVLLVGKEIMVHREVWKHSHKKDKS